MGKKLEWQPISMAPADADLFTSQENTLRWCSPADGMAQAGAMRTPIVPCRLSRPIGSCGRASALNRLNRVSVAMRYRARMVLKNLLSFDGQELPAVPITPAAVRAEILIACRAWRCEFSETRVQRRSKAACLLPCRAFGSF